MSGTAVRMIPVVTTILAAVGAALTIAIQLDRQRKAQFEQERRQQMGPMYEQLHRGFVDLVLKKSREGELIDLFHEFSAKLMLWGPKDVVDHWLAFRESSRPQGATVEQMELMRRWGMMFAAMRRDLGHVGDGVTHDDILGLFINDWVRDEPRPV